MKGGANDPRHSRSVDPVLHALYTKYTRDARPILHPGATSNFLFLRLGSDEPLGDKVRRQKKGGEMSSHGPSVGSQGRMGGRSCSHSFFRGFHLRRSQRGDYDDISACHRLVSGIQDGTGVRTMR